MIDPLAREFAARGVVRGNELYLRPADALELLYRYDAAGVTVLGAEAAELVDDLPYSRLDLIADFSDAMAHRATCTEACARFLRELPDTPNLYVTLVPDDEQTTD
jgi:hypothetical protein